MIFVPADHSLNSPTMLNHELKSSTLVMRLKLDWTLKTWDGYIIIASLVVQLMLLLTWGQNGQFQTFKVDFPFRHTGALRGKLRPTYEDDCCFRTNALQAPHLFTSFKLTWFFTEPWCFLPLHHPLIRSIWRRLNSEARPCSGAFQIDQCMRRASGEKEITLSVLRPVWTHTRCRLVHTLHSLQRAACYVPASPHGGAIVFLLCVWSAARFVSS